MCKTSAALFSLLLVVCPIYSSNASSTSREWTDIYMQSLLFHNDTLAGTTLALQLSYIKLISDLTKEIATVTNFLNSWRQRIVNQGVPAQDARNCVEKWIHPKRVKMTLLTNELGRNPEQLLDVLDKDMFYALRLHWYQDKSHMEKGEMRLNLIKEEMNSEKEVIFPNVISAMDSLSGDYSGACQCLRRLIVEAGNDILKKMRDS